MTEVALIPLWSENLVKRRLGGSVAAREGDVAESAGVRGHLKRGKRSKAFEDGVLRRARERKARPVAGNNEVRGQV